MLSHGQQITEAHQDELFDMSDGLFEPFADVRLLPHETCKAYGAGGTSHVIMSYARSSSLAMVLKSPVRLLLILTVQ